MTGRPQHARLREPVVIERDMAGPRDQYGATPEDWQEILFTMGDLRESTGKERVAAGRVEATQTATLRLRAGPVTRGLTGADRVVARGRVWQIRSLPVEMDRRGSVVELLLEAGTA